MREGVIISPPLPPRVRLFASLNLGCINVHCLESDWKQGRLLNELRSHKLDVIITAETKQGELRAFAPLLNSYDKRISSCQPGEVEVQQSCSRKVWR